MKGGVGAPDFARISRQRIRVAFARNSWNHQRRVPEGVPLFLVVQLRSHFNLEELELSSLGHRHAPLAARHVELGQESIAKDHPLTSIFPDRQFLNDGLTVPD